MPSFSIEAPAEANPLSVDSLFRVLLSAASSDQQQVQTGAKQLENWERKAGYFSSLQSIYTNLSLPIEARHLAVIQLKNAVDKYWRKTAANAVSKEEKALIRSRSLEAVCQEPDNRLALQSAVFLAKIVRAEVPKDWPDALPSLNTALASAWTESQSSMRLSRLLLVILNVIKELSGARLRGSQQCYQAYAPQFLKTLAVIYEGSFAQWQSTLSRLDQGNVHAMQQSLLTLRALRRLIMSGYDHPNRSDEICRIWSIFNTHFVFMLRFRSELEVPWATRADIGSLLERQLLQISKLQLSLAVEKAAGFAALPASVDLVKNYWSLIGDLSQQYGSTGMRLQVFGTDGDLENEDMSITEQLALKGLLILRATSKMIFNPAHTFKYQNEQDKVEKAAARDLMQRELLTVDFANAIMQLLVSRLFIITPRDLRQWEEEPIEWEKSQEGAGEDWDFSIRTCSEKLFLDLIINFKTELVPNLIGIISSSISSNLEILHMDAVYAAIGLAAPVLYDRMDFAHFLQHSLAPGVQTQQAGCNILRRRIAIVLGQWLPVKDGLNRPLVYEIFRHLLDKNDSYNDEVVRVTAGRQLHHVIDPFEFSADAFSPFVPAIIQRLVDLIEEVSLPETKLALLQTLSLIVTKMERHIISQSELIMRLLPPLWHGAADEFLLKQSILAILTALVSSMGTSSQPYHEPMVLLIRDSIDSTSACHIELQEDALDLWAAVLRQVQTPVTDSMIQLFQHIVPMIEVASDTLQRALEIVESYIHLIPREIHTHAQILIRPFVSVLQGGKRDAVGAVMSVVEYLVRSADRLDGAQGVAALSLHLLSSGLMQTIFDGLWDAHESHASSGPNTRYPKLDLIVEIDYLTVLARVTLASPNILEQCLGQAAPVASIKTKTQSAEPSDWLLGEWLMQVDNMSHPIKKKISCLALTALFGTGHAWMMNNVQLMLSMWTSVLMELEVEESTAGSAMKRDCLLYDEDTFGSGGEAERSAMADAQRVLTLADPAHRIDTRTFMREQIGVAIGRVCGGSMDTFRERWLVNVDADVLQAFAELGVL